MNIIKQIKAEIERLKNNMDDRDPLAPNQKAGYLFALADVLSFFSTIESEKPSKELEKEIERWWGEKYMKNSEGLPILPVVQGIARYFAKWGEHNALEHLRAARRTEEAYQEVAKEMRKQIAESGGSEIPNDLEEAAWDCVLDSVDVNNPVLLPKYKELLTYLFIAGAKWDREQMMKDAVEGLICATITGTNAISFLSPLPKELMAGDKVRIIVVKEDNHE